MEQWIKTIGDIEITFYLYPVAYSIPRPYTWSAYWSQNGSASCDPVYFESEPTREEVESIY